MADKSIKKLADTIIKVVDERLNQKPKSYDTQAVVRRIDPETGEAFVHIPNGIDETPVRLTVDASVGDTVQVRVADGKAWLTGNRTAPPTDDTVAKEAETKAVKAESVAEEAQETAEAVSGIANSAISYAASAKQIAEDTEQHFWFTETGADTGAHITEVTQEEWNDPQDPNYQSGGNLLARSNGIAVREGMAELASMSQAGFDAETYDGGGNPVTIAHLGYGAGTDEQGGTNNAPYYDIGVRKSGTTKGNYSISEGYDTTASGYASHAEGSNTTASGYMSHAEGKYTIAGYSYQSVIGEYNSNKKGDFFEIGNGVSTSNRSNAFEVTGTGNVTAAGNMTASGYVLGVPQYITAITSTTQTLSSQNTITTINLSAATQNTGSLLTFDGGTHDITIGAGVHYVEVYAQIYFINAGTQGYKNLYIYKNSTSVARAVLSLTVNYATMSASAIIPVSKSDKITMRAMSQNGTTTAIGSGEDVTRLTVRVIG